MRRVVLIALSLLSVSAFGQGFVPPTVEQCRRDLDQWSQETDVSRLRAQELRTRAVEMLQYRDVDGSASSEYCRLGTSLLVAEEIRFSNFLDRHDLIKQFQTEDAAATQH